MDFEGGIWRFFRRDTPESDKEEREDTLKKRFKDFQLRIQGWPIEDVRSAKLEVGRIRHDRDKAPLFDSIGNEDAWWALDDELSRRKEPEYKRWSQTIKTLELPDPMRSSLEDLKQRIREAVADYKAIDFDDVWDLDTTHTRLGPWETTHFFTILHHVRTETLEYIVFNQGWHPDLRHARQSDILTIAQRELKRRDLQR